MVIGIGIWAFIAYISFVLIWNLVFKRKLAEAMMIAWIIVCLFHGPAQFFPALEKSFLSGTKTSSCLSPILFVGMAALMEETNIIGRLIDILNSVLGRIKGGPAYVSVLASALMGLISGSTAANAATVGSITIPWMMETGWDKDTAAIINSGNAGLGVSLPPSTSMFLMLGFADVAAFVTTGQVYLAVLTAGIYGIIYRLLIVRYFVKKNHIEPLDDAQVPPFLPTLKEKWMSLIIFLGVAIPLLLTTGPIAEILRKTAFGSKGVKAIDIIIWVPIMIILAVVMEGRQYLPATREDRKKFINTLSKKFFNVAPIIVFAMCGSAALDSIGFGKDVSVFMSSLGLSNLMMVILVVIVVECVVGPLNASAATMALGPVFFLILKNAGVAPACAVAVFLMLVSNQGAIPPSSSAIYISCGISGSEVTQTFGKLLTRYAIPIAILATLIALGILPTYY
ncbi:TRAP transporter large permease subunit [Acidaminococcus fermentans]|uniref:TRAP transporter large permease subunit n=1 Tax=Acidaminococcus fermentans TaxID=905 RepID=UPI002E78FA60|nr:TRAP transporter large permease subunit [Acidaminococcus fermentans]MEE1597435.1 TRAP transporter large permease subunit [Acidaminococcus fermentans]MEE4121699.1 TRAP transporter large permease subunit [Acidaminococcus fermentans]